MRQQSQMENTRQERGADTQQKRQAAFYLLKHGFIVTKVASTLNLSRRTVGRLKISFNNNDVTQLN